MAAGRDGPEARQDIMRVAAESFARYGYRRATLREIAAGAGVDPALVRHYFGSKERLFAAVVTETARPAQVFRSALRRDDPAAADWLLRNVVADWEDPVQRRRILGLLRSALELPVARERLGQVLQPEGIAERNTDELRMALIGSLLVGVFLARYMQFVPPVAGSSPDAGPEELIRRLAPVIDLYLRGEPEPPPGPGENPGEAGGHPGPPDTDGTAGTPGTPEPGTPGTTGGDRGATPGGRSP